MGCCLLIAATQVPFAEGSFAHKQAAQPWDSPWESHLHGPALVAGCLKCAALALPKWTAVFSASAIQVQLCRYMSLMAFKEDFRSFSASSMRD